MLYRVKTILDAFLDAVYPLTADEQYMGHLIGRESKDKIMKKPPFATKWYIKLSI